MPSRKENPERSKKIILKTAEKLFLENGVSNTSLEMISRECGLTRGAVLWHFRDKASLISEMLDQIRIPIADIANKLDPSGEGDGIVRLYNFCVENMDDFVQPGRRRSVQTIIMHRCDFTPELQRVRQREISKSRELIALVERLFERHRERLHSDVSPKVATLQLHSLFYGSLSAFLREQELFAELADTRRLFSPYFKAILKDEAI